MKLGLAFVSNSSSSSFIIYNKGPSDVRLYALLLSLWPDISMHIPYERRTIYEPHVIMYDYEILTQNPHVRIVGVDVDEQGFFAPWEEDAFDGQMMREITEIDWIEAVNGLTGEKTSKIIRSGQKLCLEVSDNGGPDGPYTEEGYIREAGYNRTDIYEIINPADFHPDEHPALQFGWEYVLEKFPSRFYYRETEVNFRYFAYDPAEREWISSVHYDFLLVHKDLTIDRSADLCIYWQSNH